MVKQQLSKDETYGELSTWITSGCKGPLEELPPHIKPYWKLRNDLHCVDYVPMFNGRTIIPTGLQKQALELLHSAHQGVLSMGLRAEDSVFWPCLWKDLERWTKMLILFYVTVFNLSVVTRVCVQTPSGTCSSPCVYQGTMHDWLSPVYLKIKLKNALYISPNMA